MRDLLNSGRDLHTYFASIITGRREDEVSEEDRRKAKACNFGFPGGLGMGSFIQYAKTNYGVVLSNQEAQKYFEQWLETFPEVRNHLHHDEMELLTQSGILFGEGSVYEASDERAAWIFRGIVSGKLKTTTTHREYSQEEIAWAFDVLKKFDFPKKNQFLPSIALRKGSPILWKYFIRGLTSTVFSSGRVRAYTDYCQSKNNPFQGLAADGAKDALYELVKAGYRVMNFIHDEYLIDLPLSSDLKKAESDICSIPISSMKKYCPDVQIEVEAQWMSNWTKKGTHVLDDSGALVPNGMLRRSFGQNSEVNGMRPFYLQ